MADPASRRPMPRWSYWAFIAIMLLLTVAFAGLGKWQLNRLAEKEALIAAVASRMHQPPVALPPAREWIGLDPEVYDFRPVKLTGHFVHDQAILVFTSLGDTANGKYRGTGYWVMTPFALTGGGTIFVNRGFVPEALASTYRDDKTGPQGEVTISGVARRSESTNSFTPAADSYKRVDWVRDTPRLGTLVDPSLRPFAGIYMDMPAGPAGSLPQGGETTIEFPNNHFGYALTWFGFAIITPVMLLVWIIRQRRRKALPAATQMS
jgi:surfeit locus 1 family protein